ncbi:MAG TPA: carboxylesterase family protein [Chryseolinea sp.]|nr:carboxylesterase family protein [Chryseolinea sp.]HPM31632.1 carboxylesterase family protein [Chryseolinea sp.]
MKFLLLLILPITLTAQTVKDSLPVTKTLNGTVSGIFNSDKTIAVYKGVPFASPPVGDLRWKNPEPVKPWNGTLACNKFPASPIQNKPVPFMMWSQEFITPPEPLSEDCLYLNIWTSKSTSEKKPVFVWIHGGAFNSGSGACPIYDGEALAREGIVFVSINYRLGIFGFLAHPELTAESKQHASGNYGMLDQIAALQWIKDNITAFGGDPNKVTIAGQSAGSMSVQVLVASPLTKGLFRSAIAQSGASFSRLSRSREDGEKVGLALSQKSGNLKVLRALSADSILALGNSFPFGSFFPIIDGYTLPQDMKTIFETKKHNDVTLMAGWVMGDGALASGPPQTKSDFLAFAERTYGNKKDEFIKLFPAGSDEETLQSQTKLGLMHFACVPDRQWALYNTSKSYLYQFKHVPIDKPGFPNYGAFHTSEVPYALHTLKYWDRQWTDTDYHVEKYMSAYWINFIKTGNPNGKGLTEWKPYDKEGQSIIEFDTKPVLKSGLYKDEFQFFDSVGVK